MVVDDVCASEVDVTEGCGCITADTVEVDVTVMVVVATSISGIVGSGPKKYIPSPARTINETNVRNTLSMRKIITGRG